MNIAIILAGGKGERVGGDIPKQFMDLSGQMMLLHSMKAFSESEYVGNIQIVAEEAYREKIEDAIFEDGDSPIAVKFLSFSEPGENRQMSIYNALKDIGDILGRDSIDGVIIHDAARPFVTVETVNDCLLALDEHDGAMPVIPMNDTVYFSRSGQKVDELLTGKILLVKGSTEVAIMAGMDVAMIPGDQRNFKITSTEDMERARQIIRNE